MTALEITGYLASILIGISLGLIGGGGSILTVPVLVYLLGVNPVLATAYSLFVVGVTSLVGSLRYMRNRLVSFRLAWWFALPSFLVVLFTRSVVVPAIPDPIFRLPFFIISKDAFILLLFAVVMLAAATAMIRNRRPEPKLTDAHSMNAFVIASQGMGVGLVTGLVGAGGGFLIIPSLVLLAGLPTKTAVGTSLLIIAVNSLLGFLGDVSYQSIDWQFLLLFTILPIIGILMGSYLATFISGERLKRAFGWFVLAMGAYVMLREFGQLQKIP